MSPRFRRILPALGALATLAACGADTPRTPPVGAETTTVSTATVTTAPPTVPAIAAPPAAEPPRTRNWFDLDVGDCLTALPRIEVGEVAVPLVDCATPHLAEVYLRVPVEVNAATADVADRKCRAGLSEFTGRSGGGPYSVTYLIDSMQDRTDNNPLPSTVICLLQAVDGQPLVGSARR